MRFVVGLKFAIYVNGEFQPYDGSYPYKHSTSGSSECFRRPGTLWRPAISQPLGGTEVGCKVGLEGLQRFASTEPTPFSLILLYPS